MSEIRLRGIVKTFDRTKTIIEDLDLDIEDGSFTVLVGPSGCGKTTLLRMIAGLEGVTAGRIDIGGQDMTEMEPGDRGIAMVFQNYAIYPHMTVSDNIEFGLRNAGMPKAERRETIEQTLRVVGLEEYSGTKPAKLSGGQRQRVALARAISKRPKVFLMDEPLSNLDAQLRDQMRTELIELHRRLGSTFVYVTHDQIEAMTMGERIVIMDKGVIRQQGTPREIYRDPSDAFVARFIGNPGMNLLPSPSGGSWGFRPHDARLRPPGLPLDFSLEGRILTRETLGSEVLYCVQTPSGKVMAKVRDEGFSFDDDVGVSVDRDSIYFFDAEGTRIRDPSNLASQLDALAERHALTA
jgi:sn-glycerol 3-phosphate transport system ATP-binding protein